MNVYHKPVLVDEIIHYLAPKPGNVFLDCTLGGGGHTARVLERIKPDGIVIGFDLDSDAIDFTRERLNRDIANIRFFCQNYINAPRILKEIGISAVDGIILDLGVSLAEIKSAERGFSFDVDGPIDMRMDRSKNFSARALILKSSESEMSKIIEKYGEEKKAKIIARKIYLNKEEIKTTFDLVKMIKEVYRNPIDAKRAASRVFQAIRIAVNDELNNLSTFLDSMIDILKVGGRAAIISFHSLEDRIVKNKFLKLSGICECPPSFPVCICNTAKRITIVSKRVIRPSKMELFDNPMARSARMRVCTRIA